MVSVFGSGGVGACVAMTSNSVWATASACSARALQMAFALHHWQGLHRGHQRRVRLVHRDRGGPDLLTPIAQLLGVIVVWLSWSRRGWRIISPHAIDRVQERQLLIRTQRVEPQLLVARGDHAQAPSILQIDDPADEEPRRASVS